MWPLYFIGGFFGFMIIFYLIFFTVILPRMRKAQQLQKLQKEEERIRKEQQKTVLEKEKLERELTKQKLVADAELEMNKKQLKFCQYCGSQILPGSNSCSACGAKLKH